MVELCLLTIHIVAAASSLVKPQDSLGCCAEPLTFARNTGGIQKVVGIYPASSQQGQG